MIAVLFLLFLGFLLAAVSCPYLILMNPLTSRFYRWMTLGAALVVATVACGMTFCYSCYPNPNTRICGWPVPIVVFQRDTPDGQWLDYVGPTVILVFPINLILWLGTWFFLLWVLNFVLTRRKKLDIRMVGK
jgi:hypothetical protein